MPIVEPGIVISNSEVGIGALHISPAVHTIHCSNLAVWRDSSLRKLHIGEKLSDKYEGEIWKYLSDETKALTDKAVWNQIQDLVQHALAGDIFQDIVKQLRAARQNPIQGNIIKSVEQVSKVNYLRQGEKKSILQHLIKGGEPSQYGLYAAISRTAEDAKTYDRASELEELSTNIIQLPYTEWQAIPQAA